jgi:hypothetical protein
VTVIVVWWPKWLKAWSEGTLLEKKAKLQPKTEKSTGEADW